jgi:hypothetical protein
VVAAALFAVPAFASVPFADNCIVAWYGGPTASIIRTCPTGDWDAIDVTVRDQFNLPIAGQAVTVTLGNTTELCPKPLTGITSGAGYVRIGIKTGSLSTVDQPRISSSYTVTCMGYTIKTGTVSIMSADYNCNPTVDALDFSFFALDYLKGIPVPIAGLRSDFNNDGKVDPLDFSLFALHWLHN